MTSNKEPSNDIPIYLRCACFTHRSIFYWYLIIFRIFNKFIIIWRVFLFERLFFIFVKIRENVSKIVAAEMWKMAKNANFSKSTQSKQLHSKLSFRSITLSKYKCLIYEDDFSDSHCYTVLQLIASTKPRCLWENRRSLVRVRSWLLIALTELCSWGATMLLDMWLLQRCQVSEYGTIDRFLASSM